MTRATVVSALLLIAASAQADPLDKPVVGPKLICFKYSTLALTDGEKITDFSGSPEGMSITVDGPSGSFDIAESEIFAAAKGMKRLVLSNNQTSVYRASNHGSRYAVHGRTHFSAEKDRLVIWLSGKNLTGRKSDRTVYDRLVVRDVAGLKCDQTFTYLWGL